LPRRGSSARAARLGRNRPYEGVAGCHATPLVGPGQKGPMKGDMPGNKGPMIGRWSGTNRKQRNPAAEWPLESA
jgi:hypothetical protein